MNESPQPSTVALPVEELLLRWQEQRLRDQAITPEELCAGQPALLPELRRRIQALASMEAFLGPLPAAAGETQPPTNASADPFATLDSTPSRRAGNAIPAVPGYDVLGELGRGGMGVVYKARQVRLNRIVALKMILAGAHAGPQDRARFQAEAEAVARLQHPNIVQIYDVAEYQGLPFLSLEFCAGGSLAQKLEGNPLPPREAAGLAEALARAVHAAHKARVVHRDLKPANILMAADGTPKITDFGLAKNLDEAGQTQSGAVMGTPSYMAPEQAAGRTQEVGPAADVYALGAIFYEFLTGRPPFRGTSSMDTVLQVIHQEPVPPRRLRPSVPYDLQTICLRALQKGLGQRYPSAEALAEDLRRFLDGRPILARPVGRPERLLRWCHRNPAVAALLAGMVVLLAAVGVLALSLWFPVESGVPLPEVSPLTAAAGPAGMPPRGALLRTVGEKFALMVGVRSYDLGGLKYDLEYTESDVEEMARVLHLRGFPRQNIQLLTQWSEADNPALAPTGANIRARLGQMLRDCIPDDRVIVMLTGTGGQGGSPPMYYYLPADARLERQESLISQTELYDLFARCPARSKLLLVDTCQSAPQGDYAWPRLPELAPGFAVYFACAPGQVSHEHAKLKHGVFSNYAIEAFRGAADADRNGVVTLDELVRFTGQGVGTFLKTELPAAAQTPSLKSALPGSTPLVGDRKSNPQGDGGAG